MSKSVSGLSLLCIAAWLLRNRIQDEYGNVVTIRKQRGQPLGISCRHLLWLNAVFKFFAALQRYLGGGSQRAEMLHRNFPKDEMPFAMAVTLELTCLSPRQHKELHAFGSRTPSAGEFWPANVIDLSTYFPDRVIHRRCVPTLAPSRPRGHWTIGLITLTQLLIVSPMLFYWPDSFSGDYITGVAEHSSVLLPDGSRVALNAQSRLRVRFSAQGRDVVLLQGEALFSVAHDTVRPFRVYARGTIFETAGTDFSVNLGSDSTRIAVRHGRVKVLENLNQTPLILNPYGLIPVDTTSELQLQPEFSVGAGHEAQISREYGLTDMEVETRWVTSDELERHIAWADRQLAFAGK